MSKLICLILFIWSAVGCVCGYSAHAANFRIQDSVLYISSDCKSIENYQFADRTDFNEVMFESPARIAKIGDYAFLGCTNLKEINLPESLITMGEGCFRECISLESVTIPGKVRKLPRYTFSWCNMLSRANIPDGLLDIGSGCFAYCSQLCSISIPSTVLHLGANAFSFCSLLEEIIVPSSVTELESYAFSECKSLEKATLPANRKMLGELIFSGCHNLEEITEMSVVPPTFDCNSTLFEENEAFMYERCRLRVRGASAESYKSIFPWSRFANIVSER